MRLVVILGLALVACSGGAAAIHDVQGAAHLSPMVGATVEVRGVVTATRPTGFFLQDPNPDADDRTSEALFVFTGRQERVEVGDDVTAAGPVAEFRPGCSGGC